jgi:tetratricopeptide (TPR) repeat protein
VVGTCRPEELDQDCPLTSALPTLHRDVRLKELELGPLNEAETATLAASLTGGTIEATESRRLYQEAEGNPLFVVESLRAGQPTSAFVSDLTDSPLPPRVQAVLATRLAQLSAPARQLAEVAATIGRQFTFPVLQAVGDGDEEGLVRGLDELWQRRIVRERGADAYDFGHDKLREAAYTALSSARRRLLHRPVAQALESVHAPDLDPVSRQVAAHYRRGGLPAQAIPHYLRAGQLARDVCAQEEAIACFERGLTLLEEGTWDPSTRDRCSQMAAAFHEGMGDVLAQLARANEGLAAYGRALELLDSSERISCSRLHRKSGELWWPQGQYTEALDALAQAEAILGTPPDKPATGWTAAQVAWWLEWGHVLFRRGRILYNIAQLDEMEETLARLARGVEQSALPMLRGGYLQGSYMAALRRERYIASDGTMDLVWAASRLISASGDPVRMAEMEVGVGWASLLRADLDTAEEHLQITLALAERTSHPANRALGLTWLSVVHCRRGDVEATREYALRGLRTAEAARLLENAAMVRGNLSWLAWREGDLVEAEEQAHAALALWEESAFVYAFHWTALFPLLAVAMDREQIRQALDHARALLDPQQQKLPDPLEAALQAAIQAGVDDGAKAAGEHLKHVIQVAKETGFL